MGRTLDTDDIRDLLCANLEHPRWDDVADRCLTCGNCTLVCPTCFCTRVEDSNDLAGETPSAGARWDSCFSVDYSYIHGGASGLAASRYRQWLTHKLGTWTTSSAPRAASAAAAASPGARSAIDITEEVAAIRATDGSGHEDA